LAIGFVLINTTPGKENDVRMALDKIPEVTKRWMLFGEHDLIARLQTDEEFDLTRVIVESVRPIEGIVDTKTLIGAEI